MDPRTWFASSSSRRNVRSFHHDAHSLKSSPRHRLQLPHPQGESASRGTCPSAFLTLLIFFFNLSRVLFCCIRVIYFSSAYALPTFCLRRCSVRLRRALVSWAAYARPSLPLYFRFCLRGLHLVLLWGLRFVLSFHVLPTLVSARMVT